MPSDTQPDGTFPMGEAPDPDTLKAAIDEQEQLIRDCDTVINKTLAKLERLQLATRQAHETLGGLRALLRLAEFAARVEALKDAKGRH